RGPSQPARRRADRSGHSDVSSPADCGQRGTQESGSRPAQVARLSGAGGATGHPQLSLAGRPPGEGSLSRRPSARGPDRQADPSDVPEPSWRRGAADATTHAHEHSEHATPKHEIKHELKHEAKPAVRPSHRDSYTSGNAFDTRPKTAAANEATAEDRASEEPG